MLVLRRSLWPGKLVKDNVQTRCSLWTKFVKRLLKQACNISRIDQFWNRDIDYSTSGQAKADYEIAVRAVDGKVASGEAVARKAVKSIKTLDNHEEMLNKVKIVSGKQSSCLNLDVSICI